MNSRKRSILLLSWVKVLSHLGNSLIGVIMFKVLIYLAKNVEYDGFIRELVSELKKSRAWDVKKMKRPKGTYRLRRPREQKRFSDVKIDLVKCEEQGEPFNILHEDEKIAITYPGFSFPQVVALVKGSSDDKEAIVCGYLINHLLRKFQLHLIGLTIC